MLLLIIIIDTINNILISANCVDAVIVGSSNGVLPSPQVNIPGHLPAPSATAYRNPYGGGTPFLTGPPVATAGTNYCY